MHRNRLDRFLLTMVLASCGSGGALAQGTSLVSVDSAGVQGASLSQDPAISEDGRYVAFESFSANLVQGDTNTAWDIFVRDRQTATTTRVSVDSTGAQANNVSYQAAISDDAQIVVFQSFATNLVNGDTNSVTDIFAHDRATGVTTRVSVDSSGNQANGVSEAPAISGDGRYVGFESLASNLVTGDTNARRDVFVHDRVTGETVRVSVDSSGLQGNGNSGGASLSVSGRLIAFHSVATNLVGSDTNGHVDVFVHDRSTGVTVRESVDSNGIEANSYSWYPALSRDATVLAFHSNASNLVTGDSNGVPDVFARDRVSGAVGRVSVDSLGVQGDQLSWFCSVSGDGRYVAYQSGATNLVSGDTNGERDVFVHDRWQQTTVRTSLSWNRQESNDFSEVCPAISADGRFVAFDGIASNLVPNDTNLRGDVFLHGPHLTLLADPDDPAPGDVLSFATWGGLPAGAALLLLAEWNGLPFFVPLGPLGSFDGNGVWTLGGPVPPGLTGNTATFQSIGQIDPAEIGITELETVVFQ